MLYTAKAHTTGGREGGASRSDDGRLEVRLSSPGTPGAGTNPEQLFAAGWSACFLSAIKLAAGKAKVKLPADVAIDAEVDLGTIHGGYGLAAYSYPGYGYPAYGYWGYGYPAYYGGSSCGCGYGGYGLGYRIW